MTAPPRELRARSIHVACRRCARAALLGVLLFAAGCETPESRRRQLASPEPLARARAAVRSGAAGDPSAIPLLVNLLDDADAGVRMLAAQALDRLTGQLYGFTYYAPEADRAAAIQRMRAALQAGEWGATAGASP